MFRSGCSQVSCKTAVFKHWGNYQEPLTVESSFSKFSSLAHETFLKRTLLLIFPSECSVMFLPTILESTCEQSPLLLYISRFVSPEV